MSAVFAGSAGLDKSHLCVSVVGDIDLARREDLTRVITAYAHSHRSNLDLDLSRVEFVDTFGVDAIMTLCTIAANRGGTVVVSGVSRAVLKVFALTGVDRLCSVEPRTGALKSVE